MAATIIITLLLAAAVALAIRSIVRSRKVGGCDACGDSCSACSQPPDFSQFEDSSQEQPRTSNP
ncbi:MAG: FeoB-associated Cys-rich membrane protein [Coriobacteriales bacterium]|nr:FeoB-associated Cys-rich membrane protein [Coriobacteriales bacterium]